MKTRHTAYALSLFDLMLVDGFKEAVQHNDIHTIRRVLFENGMEISDGVELVDCEHRTLTQGVRRGPRYEGFERLDPVWIKSGAASMEAIIESTGDKSFKHELRQMSKEVPQDKAWN